MKNINFGLVDVSEFKDKLKDSGGKEGTLLLDICSR
jgi:hypothetical protein